MTTPLAITCAVNFRSGPKGQKQLQAGIAAQNSTLLPPGRIPRVARLMALAIRLDRLLAEGHIRDMAEVARLGHVTRARVTQILNLRLLAPDIQEDILFLAPTLAGHDSITECEVRPIVATMQWSRQRRLWRDLKGRVTVKGCVGE